MKSKRAFAFNAYSGLVMTTAVVLNVPGLHAAPSEAFKAAFDTCATQTTRPERGQKPSAEFETCMKEAGFDRPPHPPGGRPGPGAHSSRASENAEPSTEPSANSHSSNQSGSL
ncbi:MAG: hypothetical protein EOP09_18390 [Proteobacteria bacterium]|nr:MAG: hypothetical protein EOP09_18390 [Pseudomonadota bacterium]